LLDGARTPDAYSVRTHCKDLGDTLITSLEQIHVGVQGMEPVELRSIVHDLLVPNVRNVMLWGGDRIEDPRFEALGHLADRIVLFSSASDSALESLREVTRLEGTPIASRIRDLAYLRLLAWQDLTAQFFDDPELAAELPALTSVDITAGSQPEAYYLAGWLASRLAWEPCGDLLFCDAAGAQIRVTFHQAGQLRRIRAVELRSKRCTFGISVTPDAEDLICLTVDGHKSRQSRCVPLHDVDIVSLVERAIFSPDDGGVYLETLRLVRRLLELRAGT
jgi:glucose-6-phosphate dehydrogenase assembly protein OpcA